MLWTLFKELERRMSELGGDHGGRFLRVPISQRINGLSDQGPPKGSFPLSYPRQILDYPFPRPPDESYIPPRFSSPFSVNAPILHVAQPGASSPGWNVVPLSF